MRTAFTADMLGVKSFEDLDAYKLAVALRREVLQVIRRGPVRTDFDFVRQIRNSARGGARNISEGFSRFIPGEIHHFLSYAKASLEETVNHIVDGHESGYFTDEECRRMLTLARRTLGATRGFMRYLESPAAMRKYRAILDARKVQADSAPSKRRNRKRREPRT